MITHGSKRPVGKHQRIQNIGTFCTELPFSRYAEQILKPCLEWKKSFSKRLTNGRRDIQCQPFCTNNVMYLCGKGGYGSPKTHFN